MRLKPDWKLLWHLCLVFSLLAGTILLLAYILTVRHMQKATAHQAARRAARAANKAAPPAAPEWMNEKLVRAVRHKNHPAVKSLLGQGADVNYIDVEDTPLCAAVNNGDEDIAQLLLAHGADVNKKNGIEHPPLSLALDKPRLLRLLLDHGANPNSDFMLSFEDSVFEGAVHGGDLQAAQIMLDYGAKVNFVGRGGWLPLDYAVANKDLPMIRLLKSHGAKLYVAAISPDRSTRRLIMSQKLQSATLGAVSTWRDAQYPHEAGAKERPQSSPVSVSFSLSAKADIRRPRP